MWYFCFSFSFIHRDRIQILGKLRENHNHNRPTNTSETLRFNNAISYEIRSTKIRMFCFSTKHGAWGKEQRLVWFGIIITCLSKVTYLSAECCFCELVLQRYNEASWTSDDRTLSHRNVTYSRHDTAENCSVGVNQLSFNHRNVTCSRHDIDEHIVHFSTTITHSPSYVVSSN